MNIAENTADTAQQAANVVQADVQNQVTQSVTTLDHLKDFLLNHGPDVIYAIVIFIVGRYVARAFKNLAVRMMTHANYDHTVITFVSQLIYYAIMALVIQQGDTAEGTVDGDNAETVIDSLIETLTAAE